MAIDETFGLIKPSNDEISKSSTPMSIPKRQTLKMIRARNQTFSISKDLLIGDNVPQSQPQQQTNEDSQALVESEQLQQAPISIFKKTTKYDVIPNNDAKIDESK